MVLGYGLVLEFELEFGLWVYFRILHIDLVTFLVVHVVHGRTDVLTQHIADASSPFSLTICR